MRAYPVGKRVGSVRNNDPDLLTPLAAYPAALDRLTAHSRSFDRMAAARGRNYAPGNMERLSAPVPRGVPGRFVAGDDADQDNPPESRLGAGTRDPGQTKPDQPCRRCGTR